MRRNYLAEALAVAAAAALTSGCWFHGPSAIRDEIVQATGTEYSTEVGLTLGRTGMVLARMVAREDDDISLKGVRKLQVGVYHAVDDDDRSPVSTPVTAESFKDWDPLVRLSENGETVLVLVREKGEHIREMLVIVDDRQELVVVRLKGKLNPILEDAMELAFDRADRPELFETALLSAERELAAG